MQLRWTRAVALTLACGYGAFAGGEWLYRQAQPINLTHHYDIAGTMTQLDAVDARWNEDVLKARLSVHRNYDPLVGGLTEGTQLAQHLLTALQTITSGQTTIAKAFAAYQQAVADKNDLVEQFKSNNAILRNSAEFLPLSLHHLLEAMQEARGQSGTNRALLDALQDQAQTLVAGLLEYSTKPQETTAAAVAKTRQDLQQMLQAATAKHRLPETVQARLADVLAHTQTVLQKRPAVDALLTSLMASPTATTLQAVRTAYDQFYTQHSEHSQSYATLFFSYLAVLATLAVFLVLRLWNRHRMTLLTTMNEALEKKVELSQELSKAYEDLKRSQIRLVQSEKMSALGQMVAGIAHEMNTPLAYSRSNVALVHEQWPAVLSLLEHTTRQAALLAADPHDEVALRQQLTVVADLAKTLQEDAALSDMGDLIEASISGLDQIREMVLNLKDFSRIDRKKVDRVNLNDGIDSTLLIAQNTLKHKVTVIKQYGDIPFVTCAPSQINQVFLNLLVNAAQAMEEMGTITITTRAKGKSVEIAIADDGKGIPEEVLPHIFEPFFTTKEVGEGTGLGLAISYQLIEQHGGTLTVQSTVGRGTCFTMTLPVTPPAEMDLAD